MFKISIKHFVFIYISLKKESSANNAGDGPSSSSLSFTTEDNPNLCFLLNGIEVHRCRSNTNYKIKKLNKDLLEQRINKMNTNIKIGDIVISINGVSIFELQQSQITNMLSSTPIHSIESYSGLEWRRYCRNRDLTTTENNEDNLSRRNNNDNAQEHNHTNRDVHSITTPIYEGRHQRTSNNYSISPFYR